MKFCFEQKDFMEQNIDANRLAVIDSVREITWLQFELEVNNICSFFKKNNWNNLGKPVLIYGHKQADMIVVVYALMKMKIAYIPVDIVFPEQRILAVHRVVGLELVINCTDRMLNLENTTEIQIKSNELQIVKQCPVSLSVELPSVDPLVYVIFTSGSTGEPKGVQITSSAVQTFTHWMTSDFGFTSKDVFINVAIFSFDLSVFELMTFGALGATLLLNDKVITENPESLMQRIQKYSGTVWVSTPSFAITYSRIGNDPKLNSIKYFLFCGETLPHSLAAALYKFFTSAVIYNSYGPTEATVATTKINITQEILNQYNPLPVGYPKPNSKIVIENGEIIIVGENVSIGYLNRPELTQEKFIQIDHERAYKTGDNGYLQDGMLFFSARFDNQIKFHGYRIELDEITSKINDIEFVVQAETIALRRNGEVKKIVAVVQLSLEKSGSIVDLKKEIGDRLALNLPHYMIPSDFKIIDKMPLTQNGKSDKKELESIYLSKI